MRERDKLSEKLKFWRCERPGEWTMDELIRQAKRLEDAICGYIVEETPEKEMESDLEALAFIDQYADEDQT